MSQVPASPADRLAEITRGGYVPGPPASTVLGSEKWNPELYIESETGMPTTTRPTGWMNEIKTSLMASGSGLGRSTGLGYYIGAENDVRTGTGVWADSVVGGMWDRRMDTLRALTPTSRKALSRGGVEFNPESVTKDPVQYFHEAFTPSEKQWIGWTDEEVKALGSREKVIEQYRLQMQDRYLSQTLENPEVKNEGWIRWGITGAASLVTELVLDPTNWATLGIGAAEKAIAKPLMTTLARSGNAAILKTVAADAAVQASRAAKFIDATHLYNVGIGAVAQNVIQTHAQFEMMKTMEAQVGRAASQYTDYSDMPEAMGAAGLAGAAFGYGLVGLVAGLKKVAGVSQAPSPGVTQVGPTVVGPNAPVASQMATVVGGTIESHMQRIHGDRHTLIQLWGDQAHWTRWQSLLGPDVADPQNFITMLERNGSREEILKWHEDLEIRAEAVEKAMAAKKAPPTPSTVIDSLWKRKSTKVVQGLRNILPTSKAAKVVPQPLNVNTNVTHGNTGKVRLHFNGGFPVIDKNAPTQIRTMPNGDLVEVPKHILIQADDTTKALYMLAAGTNTPNRKRLLWDSMRSRFPAMTDRDILGLAIDVRERTKNAMDRELAAQGSYDSPIVQLDNMWEHAINATDRDPITGRTAKTFEDRLAEIAASPERQRYYDDVKTHFGEDATIEMAVMDTMVIQLARATGDTVDSIFSKFKIERGGTGGPNEMFQQLDDAFHGTGASGIRNRKGGLSTDFLSAGEGTQYKGWGIYIADRFGVAQHYMDMARNRKGSSDTHPFFTGVGNRLKDPKVLTDIPQPVLAELTDLINNYNVRSSYDKAKANTDSVLSSVFSAILGDRVTITGVSQYSMSVAAESFNGDFSKVIKDIYLKLYTADSKGVGDLRIVIGESRTASMYRVRFVGESEHYAIWDKDWASQEPTVQDKIAKAFGYEDRFDDRIDDVFALTDFSEMYYALAQGRSSSLHAMSAPEDVRAGLDTFSTLIEKIIHPYQMWGDEMGAQKFKSAQRSVSYLADLSVKNPEALLGLINRLELNYNNNRILTTPNGSDGIVPYSRLVGDVVYSVLLNTKALNMVERAKLRDSVIAAVQESLDSMSGPEHRMLERRLEGQESTSLPFEKFRDKQIADGIKYTGNNPAEGYVSKWFEENGLHGHRFYDRGSLNSGTDTPSYNTVLYNGQYVDIISEAVWQRDANGHALGSYELVAGGQRVIRALQSPDKSTFLHESGHAYLDMTEAIDKDLHEKIKVALGGTKDGPVTVAMHEQWSRAYEAYRRDHKAPSSYLKKAFVAFNEFLKDLYKTIIGTPLENQLTPEIKDLMDELFSGAERDLADMANRSEIPHNYKNPSVRLQIALDAMHKAHGMRHAALNAGQLENINENDTEVRKANAALSRVNTPNSPTDANLNYNPNTQLQAQIGVVQLSRRGEYLQASDVAKVIQTSPLLSSKDGKAWLSSWVDNAYLKHIGKYGNKMLSTGRHELVANAVPAIRFLVTQLSDTGVKVANSIGIGERAFPSLESARHSAMERSGRAKMQVRQIVKKYNLTQVDELQAVRNVMEFMAGTKSGPLTPTEMEFHALLKEYTDAWGRDAMEAGKIHTLEDNYFPVSILKSQHHRVAEIIDVIFDVWSKRFSDDASPLHWKTMKQLGWLEKKPDGEWGLRDDLLRYPNDQKPLPGAPATLKVVKDLPDVPLVGQSRSLRDLYFEALLDKTMDKNGRPERGLFREAFISANKAMGKTEIDTFTPDSPTGVGTNHAEARRIERGVWMDPRLKDIIDTNMENMIDDYGNTFGYAVKEQEITNAIVHHLTGQYRKDIDFHSLVKAIEAEVMLRTPEGEVRDGAKEAFSFLYGKLQHIRAGGLVTDPARNQGYGNFLATNYINLSQTAVASKNSLQLIAVEWNTLLANAAFGNGITGIKDFAVNLLSSLRGDRDALIGLYQASDGMRSHVQRMIIDIDQDTSIVRSWWDATLKNPARRIVESATQERVSTGRRVAGTVTAFTNGLTQVTRGLTAEHFFTGATQHMVAGAEQSKIGRTYKNWRRLAQALEAERANLQSMEKAAAQKKFRGIVRANGFGGDWNYAMRLLSFDILSPRVLDSIDELNALSGNKLFTGKYNFNLPALEKALEKSIGHPNRYLMKEAVAQLKAFIETEVDARVTKTNVLDIYTPVGGASPVDRMKMAFTSFSRTWFNKTILDRVGNERLHYALGVLGATMIAEVTYNILNKVLYGGSTVEEELAQWEEETAGKVVDTFVRSNFLGSANVMLRMVSSLVGEQKVTAAGTYPETVAFRALSSAAKLLRSSFDNSVEMKPQDAAYMNNIAPGLNTWWMQILAKATGYKGVAGWWTDEKDE